MAENHWVWALGHDNKPLTTEGPWGPYDAQTARTYARISATEGTHDRAVSRGQDPQAATFEIVRIYRAGSGEHVYAGPERMSDNAQGTGRPEGDPAEATEFARRRNLPGADVRYLHTGRTMTVVIEAQGIELGSKTEITRRGKVVSVQYSLPSLDRYNALRALPVRYDDNRALAYGELHWYKITYTAPTGGTAITHVRAPNSAEAIERAAFQIGYKPDVWSIEGMLNGEWTRL